MASSGAQVTLSGRFPAGTGVELVEVAGAHVLRAEGGRVVASGTVDGDGVVRFSAGVKVGGRYFVVGHRDGQPIEVRVRGNVADDDVGLAQPPVQPDRTRLGDGSWSDEAPAAVSADGALPGGPAQQHARDVQQRSSTARGYATPVDPDERGPYPDQASDEFSKGTVQQRSDTPLGMATPIPGVPVRQEDVPDGTSQRSATGTGVATPLVPGSPVDAARAVQSAEARALAGDPQKAAARGVAPGVKATAKGSSAGGVQLAGKELRARAAELGVKGRWHMNAGKLRAAIKRAERRANK